MSDSASSLAFLKMADNTNSPMEAEMHNLLARVTCVLLAAGAVLVVQRLILNLYSKPRHEKQAVEDDNESVVSK